MTEGEKRERKSDDSQFSDLAILVESWDPLFPLIQEENKKKKKSRLGNGKQKEI